MATTTRTEQTERQEAIDQLRAWLKPGDTVYTIVDHVSASGMSRNIRVVLLKVDDKTGQPVDLHPNWAVQTALGFRQAKRGDGFIVGGAGMDMGFHVVYELSKALWPDGFECIGERCNANDHRNGIKDTFHKSGGYALRHRWL